VVLVAVAVVVQRVTTLLLELSILVAVVVVVQVKLLELSPLALLVVLVSLFFDTQTVTQLQSVQD
jgi:hypothetical protein